MTSRDDPTIARVRETRHQISERFGHDPRKLVAYYIELQKKYEDRLDNRTGQSVMSAQEKSAKVRRGEETCDL